MFIEIIDKYDYKQTLVQTLSIVDIFDC